MKDIIQYSFLLKAIIAAVLASISCGIIGTYITSRRIVFLAGGLSHIAFGGVGLAFYLNINPVIGGLFFSILAAFGISYVNKSVIIKEDSFIGILWAAGMAIGIIFISLTPGYTPNLMTYLFGNILTVSWTNIYLMLGLSIFLIIFFKLFYYEIITVSYQEDFAKTQNINVSLFNYLLLLIIAVTIVLYIRIVGIILIIALLTIPQTTSSLFTKSYGQIIIYSILLGLISSLLGLYMSYNYDLPSGATIICVSIFFFILFLLIKKIRNHYILKRSLK